MTYSKPKNRILKDAERELFRSAMSETTPLKEKSYENIFLKSEITVQRNIEVQKKDSNPKIARAVTSQIISLRERDSPIPGIEKRTRMRLSRGKIRFEGRLDLHGCDKRSAYDELKNFLWESSNCGHRSVLVITGKGRFGEGVLRREVPAWLNSNPLRQFVRAYSNAHPKHGGAGALYILLRRKIGL